MSYTTEQDKRHNVRYKLGLCSNADDMDKLIEHDQLPSYNAKTRLFEVL